mmetsp:Transcript_57053/g.139012  ORF Transcript_57053/g.139012 Transcript_57053/m.139012 type:complete len:959 (-) Transcript_57053:110-2986(-)|eukprot:CAMPEP_0113447286 /NCGR_PEP_ID=MMETSP0014_2-20120614/4156_1 /TAXON_ID=2857 /ORGANISM="Nitzschia sp." /LENGTH=958 /DNA_ID=CAMNT_0000338429 /DNA_START=80 /DNA_END=2956 /DNA_ORIENTATION=+ /assembly_acc=CAM_ASM_000159
MQLSSLRYYEELRKNSTVVRRSPGQVLDVVAADNTNNDNGAPSSSLPEVMAFCHFIALCPFVDTSGNTIFLGVEAAYAIALAVEHLNSGNGSVIKELDGLDDRCPIKFTLGFEDTQLDTGVGLNRVVALTGSSSNSTTRLPSAFLGSFRSAVSVPTSLVSGLRGYPQLSGASTSVQLDDKTTYPKFARTIPADDGVTEAIILYLRDTLQLNHVAVLNANDAFGNSYFSGLSTAASIHAPEMSLLQITIDADLTGNEDNIRQAINTLKNSQFRYVLAILISDAMHDAVMLEALRQDVIGNGEHNWVFSDVSLQTVTDRVFEVGSDLSKAYTYAGVFNAAGNQGSRYEAFEREMEMLANPEDIEYIDQMIAEAAALNSEQPAEYINPGFLKPVSTAFSAFFYEATIAAGLAACGNVSQDDLTLTGDDFYESILSLPPFQSISGSVQFDKKTGSRLPSSTFYELSNYRAEQRIESGETRIKFSALTTNLYNNGTWDEVTPFIFSDGTTTNARGTPAITVDENLISTGMRAAALIFMSLSIIVAIGFAAWTNMNRRSRVVRASQPFFLNLISVGCVILSLAIVPLQFDTNLAPVEGCSTACTSTVWLVCIGFCCVYSALYAKTYRINKVMDSAKHFKRITVTLRSTLIPFCILLSANLVLLVLMTAIKPPPYEIFIVQTDRFDQSIETYGFCVWEEAVAFLAPLTALNTCTVFLALYEAWKSRSLTTEFAESQYIGRAVAGTLIVGGIGLPVLIIARDNSDASLFVSSGIIFVMCMLILGCIFIPKILYDRETKQKASNKGTVKISGLNDSLSMQPVSAAFSDNGKIDHTTAGGRRLTNGSEHSKASATYEDRSSECTESSELGERILTTKSQKELLHDLEQLQSKYNRMKKVLQIEREKYQALVEKVSNSTETEDDAMESALPLKMPLEMSSQDNSGKNDDPSACQEQQDEVATTTPDDKE